MEDKAVNPSNTNEKIDFDTAKVLISEYKNRWRPAKMNITNAIIALLILLALGAGVILLQIYLSKRENRWPGLILPIITLCISLVAVFGIAAFTALTTTPQVIIENGVAIQEIVPEVTSPSSQSIPSLIFTGGSVFLLYNIPTAVLLAIYFGCREKQRQRKALDKMKSQNLQ